METVLIADDEENIREGIKLIIDWEELGFTVVGDASNGEEALMAITKLQPSLVVMDMQMPKVHGMDVIKMAREQGFKGYFIILSGYSDFSYAREAIKNKVTNYITKPVDEDELYVTVKRIKEEIDKNTKEDLKSGKMQSKAKGVVARELLLGTYFDNIDSKVSEEQKEELSELGLLQNAYQVVIYETYHNKLGKGEVDKKDYSFTDMLGTFLESGSYEVIPAEGYNCILLKGKAQIARFEDFISHYEKQPIESGSPLDMLFIAMGKIAYSPEEIYASFETAKALAKRRFFCEEGAHFTHEYSDIIPESKNAKEDVRQELKKYLDQIFDAVINGNRSKLINILEEISDYIKEQDIDSSDVCLYITELLLQIKDRLTKQYPKLSDIFDSHAGIIEFIESRFYLYEIMQYVNEILGKVMDRLHDHVGSENIIDDIISYTDRNYMQPLTLEELAAEFGYNSGYLGRLFTRTTGTGYNYYLNECRIKKAKEFLSGGKYKVYEVAQMVGYSDVDYFGKKFRKHAGMTPAEFRKQSINEIE
ncbi:response regulator transcription factor [Butyrivibrio sp. AE3006]|uniref:response regulator transcription factor n=1 Tax=Butyrivibrio sp. AE3006 TaxID=1280673 RepID=UPI00068881EA|nr:response regulator [Butyrivibrio sp. AE3006]